MMQDSKVRLIRDFFYLNFDAIQFGGLNIDLQSKVKMGFWVWIVNSVMSLILIQIQNIRIILSRN